MISPAVPRSERQRRVRAKKSPEGSRARERRHEEEAAICRCKRKNDCIRVNGGNPDVHGAGNKCPRVCGVMASKITAQNGEEASARVDALRGGR